MDVDVDVSGYGSEPGIGISLLVAGPGVTCYQANGQQTARPT